MPDKCIILGVTGSIAAYKAAELTSSLVKKGYQVHVIMTAAAAEFITPLTLQTISRNQVHQEMFDHKLNWNVEHISLAQSADLLVVAPATANLIAKLAAGMADDLLSSTILATRAPVLLAPAMNTGMYENTITQHNLELLKGYGYFFVEPEVGLLACGDTGKGRLPATEKIISKMEEILCPRRELRGRKVLVTAGPTREALDPVRYLTNHSSGKMGYALAREACAWGASVTLVSGPTQLEAPEGVEFVPVVTAQEMFDAVVSCYSGIDVVVMAAAVADYRPYSYAREKIKKSCEPLSLKLERTPDILQYLSEHKVNQFLVGFAAETENLMANAWDKLTRKRLNLLVANNLTTEGAGFEVDTNVATILDPGGLCLHLPKMLKQELARKILDEVCKQLTRSRGGEE